MMGQLLHKRGHAGCKPCMYVGFALLDCLRLGLQTRARVRGEVIVAQRPFSLHTMGRPLPSLELTKEEGSESTNALRLIYSNRSARWAFNKLRILYFIFSTVPGELS